MQILIFNPRFKNTKKYSSSWQFSCLIMYLQNSVTSVNNFTAKSSFTLSMSNLLDFPCDIIKMFMYLKINWFSSSESDGFKFSDWGLDIQTRKLNSNASRQLSLYIPNNDVMQKHCPTFFYLSLNCTK